MYILSIFIFTILFLYVLQISVFIYGFIKIKSFNLKKHKSKLENKKYLSVLIPFKNEKDNLKQLVKNLSLQSLSKNNFEVIFINDNSNDNSENILKDLIKEIPNFTLINSEKKGKKNAIKKGIKHANTNVIVTSDADCKHQKHWLEEIINYYLLHKPKMIIAPVLMVGKSFFQKLQTIDFLSLTASTAGAAGINKAIMCNGANLIYDKSVYNEFEDALNSNEVSGDDIFLLHNIKKKYPKDIHYLKSKNAIVYTEAEESINSFFKQRLRWASKSKSYNDLDTIISAILVFGVNILFIALLLLSFFDNSFFISLLYFWIIKFGIDAFLLIIAGKYFMQFPNLIYLFLLSLLYPFYIVFTATVSFFIKTIAWKS